MQAVNVGSVWRRRDPSGKWQEFTVVCITQNPRFQVVARGKAARGRYILASVRMMSEGNPRFELVRDA